MTRDELLASCLSKPGAWQDEPWDGDTVVKVAPKIFAVLGSGDGAATHGSVGSSAPPPARRPTSGSRCRGVLTG